MPKRTEVRANLVTMATFQAGRSVLVACWPCPGKEGADAAQRNAGVFRCDLAIAGVVPPDDLIGILWTALTAQSQKCLTWNGRLESRFRKLSLAATDGVAVRYNQSFIQGPACLGQSGL